MTSIPTFELDLKGSAIEHLMRALEQYRYWFPRSNIKFQYICNDCYYDTYVDNSSRIKLEPLIRDYGLKAKDLLVFRKVGSGTEWEITPSREGERLVTKEETSGSRKHEWREAHSLTRDELIDLLAKLAVYYDMLSETSFAEKDHEYPVIWRRISRGNPVWAFEITESSKIDSCFVRLKHARDIWNADLVLIVQNMDDLFEARRLLEESFHEIRKRTTLILSWDLLGLLESKEKYDFADSTLSR